MSTLKTLFDALAILEKLAQMPPDEFSSFLHSLGRDEMQSLRDGVAVLHCSLEIPFQNDVSRASESFAKFVSFYQGYDDTFGVIGRRWPAKWPPNASWAKAAMENGIKLPKNTLIFVKGLLKALEDTAK